MYDTSANESTALARREDFGGTELTHQPETASTAVAAQAKAAIEARYILAMRRPRDFSQVRVQLLRECQRPGFAQSAWYKKPIGKGVEGFSVRFAEAAARCMTNIMPEVITVYDDREKRIVRVSVTDLEANVTYSKDVTISKTVERSSVKEGQEVFSSRQNSQGRATYLVAASEDDMLQKEGSLVSKAMRNMLLRLVPGDILDECEDVIMETRRRGENAQDPDAARKKIVDAFASLGVMPADLRAYLGQEIASVSPAQLQQLRDIYTAIKAGELTWKDVIADRDDDPPPPRDSGSGPKSPKDVLRDKLAAKKGQQSEAQPEPKEEPPKAPLAPASQAADVPKVVELLGPQGPPTAEQRSALERTEGIHDLDADIAQALADAAGVGMEKTKIRTWADRLDHFHSRGDTARLASELEKFRGVIEKKEAEQRALAAYTKSAPAVHQPEPLAPPRAILIINAAEQRGVISKDEAQGFRAAYAGAPDADAAAEEEDAILEALAEKEGGILLEAGRRAGLVSPQPKREWLKAAPKIEGGAWDRGIKYLIGKGLAVKHGTGAASKYSVAAATLAERASLAEVPKSPVPAAFQPDGTPIERANAWTAAIISAAYVKGLIDDDRAQELEQAAREAYDDQQIESILAIANGLKARAKERGIVLE